MASGSKVKFWPSRDTVPANRRLRSQRQTTIRPFVFYSSQPTQQHHSPVKNSNRRASRSLDTLVPEDERQSRDHSDEASDEAETPETETPETETPEAETETPETETETPEAETETPETETNQDSIDTSVYQDSEYPEVREQVENIIQHLSHIEDNDASGNLSPIAENLGQNDEHDPDQTVPDSEPGPDPDPDPQTADEQGGPQTGDSATNREDSDSDRLVIIDVPEDNSVNVVIDGDNVFVEIESSGTCVEQQGAESASGVVVTDNYIEDNEGSNEIDTGAQDPPEPEPVTRHTTLAPESTPKTSTSRTLRQGSAKRIFVNKRQSTIDGVSQKTGVTGVTEQDSHENAKHSSNTETPASEVLPTNMAAKKNIAVKRKLVPPKQKTKRTAKKRQPQSKSMRPRDSNDSSSSDEENMMEAVSVWQGDRKRRLYSDLIDLDVLLTKIEDIGMEFKQEIDTPIVEQAVDHFMHQLSCDVIQTIDKYSELKFTKSALQKMVSEKTRLRQELLASQQKYQSLLHDIEVRKNANKFESLVIKYNDVNGTDLTQQQLMSSLREKQHSLRCLHKLKELNEKMETFVNANQSQEMEDE